MGDKSAIEWTDATWNPVTGCTKVSAGCKNCYAKKVADRFWKERAFTDVRTHEDRLEQPLHWRKPRKIFVNSMSDLFHEDVPFEFIAAVFGIMAASGHTFQVLTKRALRMLEFVKWIDSYGGIGCYIRSDEGRAALRVIIGGSSGARIEEINGRRWRTSEDAWAQVMNAAACVGRGSPLSNVWLGVSVEDQKTADERIPLLLQTPAAVRFVSYEPALRPVDFGRFFWIGEEGGIDWSYKASQMIQWLICGGESGPGARPFNVQWARDVIRQCKAAGVACFVKQLGRVPFEEFMPQCDHFLGLDDRKGGDWSEWPSDLKVREFPR